MKRLIVLLLVLIIMIVPMTAFADSSIREDTNLKGAVFMKNINEELEEEFTVNNVKIIKLESTISGSLKAGESKITFLAEVIKKEDGIGYYNGILYLDNKDLKCDVVENGNGLSIIYYDNTRKYVRLIILSNNGVNVEKVKNEINKEIVPKIKTDKFEHEIIEEPIEGDAVIRSYPINHTHHMFKDSLNIPLIIGGGTVEGWFHYQTNIDPSAKFYAVDMDAIINWESGFDGVTITSEDEMYGIFWGTPSCPTRNFQTYSIGMMAEEESPYKMEATVSYYLLVECLPVIFWDTDVEYLSY